MTIEKLGKVYRAFIKEDIRLAAEESTEEYGHPFTRSRNIAEWLQEQFFPDAQIAGYFVDDPESKLIGAGEGGHDFLLVNGRYILDFWPRAVIDRKSPIAYDLHTKEEQVILHYGHPDSWIKSTPL